MNLKNQIAHFMKADGYNEDRQQANFDQKSTSKLKKGVKRLQYLFV